MLKSINKYRNHTILLIALLMFSMFLYQGCQKESNVDQRQEIKTPPQKITLDQSGTGDMAPKTESRDNTRMINMQLPGLDKQITQENTQDKRMIIRSGTMSLEVDKYDETETKILDIAKKFNGFITNTSTTLNPGGKKQGTITIRVAAERFDAMLIELRQAGKEMNENITGNDVTEEYIDAEARVKTQRQLEERLLKLLDEKTAKLTDIVDVEQKLSSVRENIEKTEGRLKFLRDQAAFSTLAVSVYEPSLLSTSTGGGFFYELGQAVKKGLSGFTFILSGLITVLIAMLPIIIIVFLVVYFLVKYLKRKKRNTGSVINPPIAEKKI